MKLKILSIALLFLLTLRVGIAQDAPGLKDTIQIKEVVVTGSPVKISRNNIPMSVSVLKRHQITEGNESSLLSAISGKIPGLFVTERGVTGFGVAEGSAGQINMRGIGGSPTTGVLVLIDGHPQFMGIFGHPLPDSYVSSDVEQVEVIRGPGSVLYGSNAMGGVINIITKKQQHEGFDVNAHLQYGSYNTQKYMGSAGYKKDKFSIYASVNHDQTDGHRDNSDFDITNGYIKSAYQLSDHFNLSGDFGLAGFKASDPGADLPDATAGEKIEITRGYWAASLQNEFDKTSGTFRIYHNFGEHDVTDGFHSTDFNYGLNLYESFEFFEGNKITMGVDYAQYGGMAENLLAMQGAGMVFADTSVYEIAGYGFIQQNITDKLIANAGLRYNSHNMYGDEWIPSFGMAYDVSAKTDLKANIAKGYRSPTMRELFLWGPNPNLLPESIWNYEVGMLNSFLDNKLQTEITLYALNGDNLIQQVPNQGYQNSGEVSNKGIEISADYKLNNQFSFNLAYSYTDMENPVYATPKQQLYLIGRYHKNKFSFNASIQHVSDLDSDATSAVSLQTFSLVNAKVSYQIASFAQIFVNGENLLDQEYETNLNYTMPEATVFTGINLHF